MSFYTGTAASISALRSALLTHAQADGWVLSVDVLSKNGVFFQITETASDVRVLGCLDNAVASPAPGPVKIGNFYTGKNISFPCTYYVFGFAQELYFVVNYDSDTYQWLAFGKSTVPGLLGTGAWCAANAASTTVANIAGPVRIESDGEVYVWGYTLEAGCPAMFWDTSGYAATFRNAWVHHGLDGRGWMWGSSVSSNPLGHRSQLPLVNLNPSTWNSEAVMLPIQAWLERPVYKSSLICDLQNARNIRIDNVEPRDILTLGTDKWMIFPWYKKSTVGRNGGSSIDHSGTYGWVIRYEGP